MHEFLRRRIDHTLFPCLLLDATYLDVRHHGRVVSHASSSRPASPARAVGGSSGWRSDERAEIKRLKRDNVGLRGFSQRNSTALRRDDPVRGHVPGPVRGRGHLPHPPCDGVRVSHGPHCLGWESPNQWVPAQRTTVVASGERLWNFPQPEGLPEWAENSRMNWRTATNRGRSAHTAELGRLRRRLAAREPSSSVAS